MWAWFHHNKHSSASVRKNLCFTYSFLPLKAIQPHTWYTNTADNVGNLDKQSTNSFGMQGQLLLCIQWSILHIHIKYYFIHNSGWAKCSYFFLARQFDVQYNTEWPVINFGLEIDWFLKEMEGWRSRNGWDGIMRRSHLSQNFVQPLQRAIQMNLYPAGGASHILAVVLGPPALDKAHPYSTHFSEFVDSLKAVVDRLTEEGCEFLVVEYLQAAARRNLADCGWVKSMVVVAVTALDKYTGVTQALCKHLSSHVIQMHTYNKQHKYM